MRPEDVAAEIPKPSIKIDNEHDPFATIVCIGYGDRLGELLDTVRLSRMICNQFALVCGITSQALCAASHVRRHGDLLVATFRVQLDLFSYSKLEMWSKMGAGRLPEEPEPERAARQDWAE